MGSISSTRLTAATPTGDNEGVGAGGCFLSAHIFRGKSCLLPRRSCVASLSNNQLNNADVGPPGL